MGANQHLLWRLITSPNWKLGCFPNSDILRRRRGNLPSPYPNAVWPKRVLKNNRIDSDCLSVKKRDKSSTIRKDLAKELNENGNFSPRKPGLLGGRNRTEASGGLMRMGMGMLWVSVDAFIHH